MGWTSWNTANDKRRFATAGDYLADSYTRTAEGRVQDVIAHKTVKGVWYAALRVRKPVPSEIDTALYGTNAGDYTVALVVLTEGRWGGQWSEKGMDETAGPYYFDAPASVLNKLTPLTDHRYAESAKAWRASCREVAAGRRAA